MERVGPAEPTLDLSPTGSATFPLGFHHEGHEDVVKQALDLGPAAVRRGFAQFGYPQQEAFAIAGIPTLRETDQFVRLHRR